MPPLHLGAIRHVLSTYPFSKGLFREILQNSEDAGATKQIFVVDHRNYNELSIDQFNIAAIRGPSLLAYNDAVFTDQDFQSLFNLWDSSKKRDASKVGKFGMGFRSTFHVTDTPQVLSESTLVILDPLKRISQTEDIKLDLTQHLQGARLAKHFALDFFRPGHATGEKFPGSVVRLPLRTEPSGISHETLTAAELRKLLVEFAQEEVRIALLFLKNVTTIEIYEIDAAGAQTCHIVSSISKSETIPLPSTSLDAAVSSMNLTVASTAHWLSEAPETKRWCILQTSFSPEKAASGLSSRIGRDVTNNLIENKLHPVLAIAAPLSILEQKTTYSTFGRLFTYLPLPLMTKFCVHIHGLFALTPSREKLQNREEIPGHRSDYHISLEWNKLLFEEYLPQAWMYLLRMLISEGIEDIFMAWPPAQTTDQLGDSGYWEQLPLKLLEYLIESKSPVWPVVSSQAGVAKEYLTLDSVLVAAADEDLSLLQTLATFGLKIIRPPRYIVQLITSKAAAKVLSPVTAYQILQKHPQNLLVASNADKISRVLLYLLSTEVVNHLIGLPVIPISNNRHVALRPCDDASTIHTLLEAEEFRVFGARDENAIPLSRLDPAIARLLKRRGPDVLNVQVLSPEIAMGYLRTYPKAPGLDPGTGKLDAKIVSWILVFWNWMKASTLSRQLYPMLAHMPLLPAQDGLKHTDSHIFDQTGLHPTLVSNLKKLGISFLHQNFTPHRQALTTFRKFSDALDLHDFLDALTMENVNAFQPDDWAAAQLVKHIVSRVAHTVLSDEQRVKLRHLPIYPLAVAPRSRSSRPRVSIEDGQRVIGVVIENLHTLPIVQGITFLNGSEVNFALLQMLDPTTLPHVLDADLLRFALDYFMMQTPASQYSFVKFMAQYRSKLPGELFDQLGSIPFVETPTGTRRCPRDLVDPRSSLSPLFSRESDRFPRMRDKGEIKLVDDLRSMNLMETALSTDIIKERIRFISSNEDQEVAHALLRIIYTTRFKLTIMPEIILKWLPTPKGLLAPDQCRDEPHRRELFDQVLSPLDGDVKTGSSLREFFGWNQPLAVSVLVKQLSYMLIQPSGNAYHSIYSITKELIDRRLSRDEIASVRKTISDRPWVPISELGKRLAITEHAVFSGEDPTVGFYQIPFAGAKAVDFFKAMGCTDIPSTKAILGKLKLLGEEAPSALVAQKALHLLRLLPAEMNDEERSQVLVPDTNHTLRSFSSIFYNDLGFVPPGNRHVAYSKIDDNLANSLRMERLGLDSHTKLFAIDMEVQLTTVIRNKLQSYTPQQILPEFLANAADAGATEFGIFVDEASALPPGQRILTEKMAAFQTCPSVIIYNNAVFTESDFEGICRTGIGGKVARSDSIGQFGSGALTMFHLTELAMIVSGDYVLFLNPSKRDLPKTSQGLRVTLPMSLKQMRQDYPGHLACLDGVFGFELSSPAPYNATLFRLPLRMSVSSAKGPILGARWTIPELLKEIIQPFEDSSEQFLLFSKIREITVHYRKATDNELHCRWRSTATQKSEHSTNQNRSKIIDIEIHREAYRRTKSQTWHIVSTSLPGQDLLSDSLAEKYRLRLPIELALAAQVDGTKPKTEHKLFSTLPLPGPSSLPVHLTAPFILSDDRRHIRLDDYDTVAYQYNQWLLSTAIPPLYMFLLADLLQTHDNNLSWWPGDTDKEDRTTSLLTTSFYGRHLKNTDQRVFRRTHCTSSPDYLLPKDAFVMHPGHQRTLDKILGILMPCLALLPHRVALRAMDEAKVPQLTPEVLKNLIIQSPASPAPHLEFKDLDKLHHFLYAGGRPENLVGLRLLPVADGTFAAFENKTTDLSQTYFVADRKVHDLFPSNGRLVHPEFRSRGLLSFDINVVKLNGPAITALLSERLVEADEMEIDETTEKWITLFWEGYSHLEAKWEDVAAFPLVPTTMSGRYTSINNCKRRSAVVLGTDFEDRRIWQSLSHLGLTVVERHAEKFPRHLKLSGQDFPHFAFPHALQAMESLQFSISDRFNQLDPELRTLFSRWCRDKVASSHIPGNLVQFARTLPIWPASSSHSSTLSSAEQITMLPADIPVNIARRFTNVPFTQYSNALVQLGVAAMTFPSFLGILAQELPPILPAEDTAAYRSLLEIFTSNTHDFSSFDALRVPDCSRVLVHPRELYKRDRLFLDAFRGSPGSFLFGEFEDLEDRLVAFGLQQGLDFEIFNKCARAIHDSVNTVDSELVQRAMTVYEAYCEELPLRISSREQHLWQELDRFRFIPRDSSRHKSITPLSSVDPLEYANSLPLIVSPAELLLPEFERIAWTQRGIFLEQPDERILRAYPAFGCPTFPEVVKHLVVLARQVLIDHPSNPHILHDLRETYQWLNENCDPPEASRLLLQHHSEPLFLNVVDPSGDTEWQWHSASELLLDEPRGFGDYHPVHGFLSPFANLLRASGVKVVSQPDPLEDSDIPPDTAAAIRDSFLEMRKAKQLTDVAFHAKDNEVEILPGHRSFLATYSTFFHNAFTNDMEPTNRSVSVSDPKIISVKEYTSRCVAVALDFVYTGRLPDIDGEEDCLDLLLEVTELSDYWQMARLHDEVQRYIIRTRLITGETCIEIQNIATKYQATLLVDACKKYREKNGSIIRSRQ